eukprot:3449874-Pyramimonas_sp.AAC.1
MSKAVCLLSCPTSLAFRADSEDVSGGTLVSAPLRGAARGVITGPFAAKQSVRMSQVGRWFQHP